MVGTSQGVNERLRMYSLGLVSGRLPEPKILKKWQRERLLFHITKKLFKTGKQLCRQGSINTANLLAKFAS